MRKQILRITFRQRPVLTWSFSWDEFYWTFVSWICQRTNLNQRWPRVCAYRSDALEDMHISHLDHLAHMDVGVSLFAYLLLRAHLWYSLYSQ